MEAFLNPFALRMAKNLWSFGHSECNRVNDTMEVCSSGDPSAKEVLRIAGLNKHRVFFYLSSVMHVWGFDSLSNNWDSDNNSNC